MILLVLTFMLSGCTNKVVVENKSFESLNYEVTECLDFGDVRLNITFVEGEIIVNQLIELNCCSEIELSYKKTEGVLRVYEDFSGEECDCNCWKEVYAEINGKGVNEIEFYSRGNKEYPYELLLEKEIV